jgi:acetolactate decarboxylase
VTQQATRAGRPATRPVKGPTAAQILRRGDHGVGVLGDGESEFIVVGGRCFTLHPDGTVAATGARARAHSAAVTRFRPEYDLLIRSPRSFLELLLEIDRQLPRTDAIAAVRIDAWFSFVRLISGGSTTHPHAHHGAHPDQGPARERELSDVVGTVAGFRNVALEPDGPPGGNDHFHFVDDQRSRGGHVVDLEVLRARVLISVAAKVRAPSQS